MKVDAFVIGGGPAGLVAAIALRRAGWSVILADARTPPIDKACGEGLMPDARAALARLEISVPAGAGFPFHGIRFVDGSSSVDADFPNGPGIGVRRTALHASLAEQAQAAGVELRWGTRVIGIGGGVGGGEVQLVHERIPSRWIIGADGGASRVRTWAGLEAASRHSRRFGFRRHYACAPWSRCMEIYWGAGHQIYITPVRAGEVCVALISRDAGLRLDRALKEFPELRERLSGAAVTSQERGSAVVSRKLRRVCCGNVALLGDASGSVDAITGEGMCLSFLQASALARAAEAGDLARYQAEHRRLMRRPAFMADLMLLLGDHPRLRAKVIRALAAHPAWFEKMLAMHVGQLHPARFAAVGLSLGARILLEEAKEFQ